MATANDKVCKHYFHKKLTMHEMMQSVVSIKAIEQLQPKL